MGIPPLNDPAPHEHPSTLTTLPHMGIPPLNGPAPGEERRGCV